MTEPLTPAGAAELQLRRQAAHWAAAAARLGDLNQFASTSAWRGLERYLGTALIRRLASSVSGLVADARRLEAALAGELAPSRITELAARLGRLRRRYVQTETTLDFFGDAINTRSDPSIAALLRAGDILARQSMESALSPSGRHAPPVLTYLDKGLGASILKAGLRLWDGGTVNPAAAIKIVRHNLFRPTSLVHEAGHQVAHMLHWNEELAEALARKLPGSIAGVWSGWASEIAADAFGFAHTGYGSVAALHDVVAGSGRSVFRFLEGDPHPVSYLRVLLGTATARHFYGDGPWDDLESGWRLLHPLSESGDEVAKLVELSEPVLPAIVAVVFERPARAFGGASLAGAIDPQRVNPASLARLENAAGGALFRAPGWMMREGLRTLALSSYRIATEPAAVPAWIERQRDWMLRMGGEVLAA